MIAACAIATGAATEKQSENKKRVLHLEPPAIIEAIHLRKAI
jgi:hypothetical protein